MNLLSTTKHLQAISPTSPIRIREEEVESLVRSNPTKFSHIVFSMCLASSASKLPYIVEDNASHDEVSSLPIQGLL